MKSCCLYQSFNMLPLLLLSLCQTGTLVVVFLYIKRNTHFSQRLPHENLSDPDAHPLSMPFSLGNDSPHTPPKVAPQSPASFPSICIDKLKAIPKAWSFKLRDIRHVSSQSRGLKRRATTLVQIKLIRLCQTPSRPVRCRI